MKTHRPPDFKDRFHYWGWGLGFNPLPVTGNTLKSTDPLTAATSVGPSLIAPEHTLVFGGVEERNNVQAVAATASVAG